MKVLCIGNSDVKDCLTKGKAYNVIDYTRSTYLITDDKGVDVWYSKARFIEFEGLSGDKRPKGPGFDDGMTRIRPSYYNETTITPFDYIKANDLDFFEGNVIKYITRHRQKNGKEDLIKAITYIEELIKEYDRNE